MHIEQVTFDGLSNGSMFDPLTLTHLVQVEISVVAHSHIWLGKTLNAWISIARRNKFMRFAHEQVTFDGLSNGPMSDLLNLSHLVQAEISAS